jgi:hypothetical protein
MIRSITVCFAVVAFVGCSGSIKMSKIPYLKDEKTCTIAYKADPQGLRYFKPVRVEVNLYRINKNKTRIDRMGDVLYDVVPDEAQLWEITYNGALFVNDNLTMALNDKGSISSIGLSNTGSTPGIGAFQAIQKGLETQRDFDKTREQARIDELTRQADLIKAEEELRKALTP